MVSRGNADRDAVYNGDLDYFYNQGYAIGYKWLNPNQPYAHNFKHPSEKGGYIPGGPSLGIYVRRADQGYGDNWQDKIYASNGHSAWQKGFKDGINAYVKDNNLDYPMI